MCYAKGEFGAMVCTSPPNPTHATTNLILATMMTTTGTGANIFLDNPEPRAERAGLTTRSLLAWKNDTGYRIIKFC